MRFTHLRWQRPGGRSGWVRLILVLVLASQTALVRAQQAPAGGASSFAPPLSLPSAFANLPGTPQYSRNAQQRALADLLRGFEAVAAAEVAIAGPEAAPNVAVILKPRAGQTLDAVLLTSLARLILGAVPGLTPQNLQITATSGQLLYASGEVQAPPAAPPGAGNYVPWLLGLTVLAAGLAAWPFLRRGRPRPAAPAGPDRLAGLDPQALERLLDGERPELWAVLQGLVGERGARRLARQARRHGLPAVAPAPVVDPEIAQAVVAALERKAERADRSGEGRWA